MISLSDDPQQSERDFHGPHATKAIEYGIASLTNVLESHPDDGDWWHQVKHARDYLVATMESSPPGTGVRADYYKGTQHG